MTYLSVSTDAAKLGTRGYGKVQEEIRMFEWHSCMRIGEKGYREVIEIRGKNGEGNQVVRMVKYNTSHYVRPGRNDRRTVYDRHPPRVSQTPRQLVTGLPTIVDFDGVVLRLYGVYLI